MFNIKTKSRNWCDYFISLVGGGSLFSAGGAQVGGVESLALGLVPAGLTPVAFFPSNPNQQMKAVSVIFREPSSQRRMMRTLNPQKRHNFTKKNRKHRRLTMIYLSKVNMGLYLIENIAIAEFTFWFYRIFQVKI